MVEDKIKQWKFWMSIRKYFLILIQAVEQSPKEHDGKPIARVN